jgi:phenylalanyl-tRNA synthetase beta chain
MKVLLSWLKEFVDIAVDPRRLADDLTLVGLAVDAVEPVGGDTLLDLDITTNRVDCMNVYGVAREVSVLYRLPLRLMDLSFVESGPPAAEGLDVAVEATDLCPRFCARVLDVRMGAAPSWMRDRLEAVGVRSINNIVDVTNYVMMEMGQPSHAFDVARIPGGRLRVRWAKEGESLVTLDGALRKLGGRVGVVAGPESPLALAGIMGGASSEVSSATRAVALEAAYWDPLAIRRAAKALGMHTEASHRFERGADPDAPGTATARISHLLQKIDAGSTRPGLIDRRVATTGPLEARLRASRVSVVLGDVVAETESRRILEGLGFAVGASEGEGVAVTIPSWRGDVSREIDLIEEVGRYHGLDRIPSTIPSTGVVGGLRPWQVRERATRQALVAAGLTEVVHYAFVSETEAAPAPGARVALANPLSEEQAVLRNSLVMPGLLGALRANLRQGRRDVALFEIGRVFTPGETMPLEERRLGFLLSGALRPAHWSERPRAADFFDVKGIAESVLARLGAADATWTARGAPAFLQQGKAAAALRGDNVVGYVGAVRPDVAAAFESKDEVLVGELLLDDLLAELPAPERFRALDRFPPVSRDLSVLCDAGLSAAALLDAIRGAAGELLRSVTIIDRYDRPPVPEGHVSLTVTLLFQSQERTLTGEEVQEAVERVVRDLRGRRAEIRGE